MRETATPSPWQVLRVAATLCVSKRDALAFACILAAKQQSVKDDAPTPYVHDA
jgi:hypothetical protein